MNIQGVTPSITAAVSSPQSMATTKAASSSSSSSSSGTSDLQTTFLNLLITELQNQDPTSPVDPTAMVGQMVSLNQLDQLISINQTLEGMSSVATSGSSTQSGTKANSESASALMDSVNADKASTAATQQDALTPNATTSTGAATGSGFMNLYGGYGMPAANAQLTTRGAY